MKRISYLDGLRAVASLAILFHHSITSFITGFLDARHMAFLSHIITYTTQSGVELFFVLSGLVLSITSISKTKTFSIPAYFRKRITRIYPPYFFAVLFAGMVIFFNTYFPTWYSAILIKFTIPGFIKQFFIFNQKWDFYNLAWWSLQLEMLFYILLPFIIPRIDKIRKLSLGTLVATCLLLTIGLQQFFVHQFPASYSTDASLANLLRMADYIVCFALGIWLSDKMQTVKFEVSYLLLGIAIICGSYYYHAIAHFGWGLVYFSMITLAQNRESIRRLFDTYFFRFFGERSYSIFLTHFSVFYLTNYLVSMFTADRNWLYGVLTRSIGIPFALLVAFALFYFVEKKFAKGLETADDFLPSIKKMKADVKFKKNLITTDI